MNTLLIDDDPLALKLLARQLEQLGCVDIAFCGGAQEAMTVLEARGDTIRLVFCDLQMPDIDGVEFVRHLARIRYRGSLVLVSGEEGRILQTVHKLALAHRLHVLGALRKPVSVEDLKQVLASDAQRWAAGLRVARQPFARGELLRAIAGGQLVNYYQPLVNLTDGALTGVETLVRWQHPQAGLVLPDRFITLAEEHDLIDDLTLAVLTGALRQARQWRDVGLEIKVAVNISMDNLAALDFPEMVVRLAGEAGVDLASLVLEVTESRLMQDVRVPLDILTRLRLKHVGLSIDDFGTGYSSLAQLRDIPFDELKLDRGFVNGAAANSSLGAIVEGALAMAGQLGMRSVGEGVEYLADWEFLRARGCNMAQGYFIAQPMPGADLLGWKAGWEVRRHELTAAAS